MNNQTVQHRDIYDAPISVFQVAPYYGSDGAVKTQWKAHHVRTIGQYLDAAKKYYAATIDQTRGIMQSAVEAWENGDTTAYKNKMLQYKFNKWLPPVAIMQGVNPKHSDNGFESFSNVLCLDIDAPKPDEPKNGNEWIPDNLEALKRFFGTIPFVAYCGLSAGGRGLFILIPIADHEHHKDYWRQLQTIFRDICKIEIDKATYNMGRLRFMSYDDTAIINHHAQVFDKLPEPPRPEAKRTVSRPARFVSNNDDEERICKAVEEIAARHIDITQDYEEWKKAAAAIAHTLGERGRSLFHTVARQSSKYREKENERLYDGMMKEPPGRECTISSFFHLCKYYGIDIRHHGGRGTRVSPAEELRARLSKRSKDEVRKEPPQVENLEPPRATASEPQPLPPIDGMSHFERLDLQWHQEYIDQASAFLEDAKVQHPAVLELCKAFDLKLAGCNGWRMTDAQFNYFHNQKQQYP